VITDPDVVRILCFGDSHTHGAPSDDPEYVRLPADQRWTGLLQGILGHGFDVIEEGLNGRTTDMDYDDRPGCNGREYFVPCLQTHHPLDAVVVMLGTNDLKTCFDRSATAIADALRGYLDDVEVNVADPWGRTPAVVLISPIRIDDTAPLYAEMTADSFDSTGVARSRELGPAIRGVAQEGGATYADAAEVARAGDDGLHLTRDSHGRLADLVATTISRVLSDRLEPEGSPG
jgi:lysophospholipase L1-like esterase